MLAILAILLFFLVLVLLMPVKIKIDHSGCLKLGYGRFVFYKKNFTGDLKPEKQSAEASSWLEISGLSNITKAFKKSRIHMLLFLAKKFEQAQEAKRGSKSSSRPQLTKFSLRKFKYLARHQFPRLLAKLLYKHLGFRSKIIRLNRLVVYFSLDKPDIQGILAGISQYLPSDRRIQINPNFIGRNEFQLELILVPFRLLIAFLKIVVGFPFKSFRSFQVGWQELGKDIPSSSL